jgi:LacI family transcriptional regulator
LSREVTSDIAEHLRTTFQEVVLVDTQHSDFESISIRNEEGGYIATRHLLDRGHDRIAHITAEEPEPLPAKQRRKGYERALSEAGQSPILARGGGEPFAFSKEGGRQAMESLLKRDALPDGVFASSDMQALGAREAAEQAGYQVPSDIALVGFDDVDLSKYVGLTTIRQPLLDFGKLAIEKLLGRIDDPERRVSSTVFDPELVVRQTCASAKSREQRE